MVLSAYLPDHRVNSLIAVHQQGSMQIQVNKKKEKENPQLLKYWTTGYDKEDVSFTALSAHTRHNTLSMVKNLKISLRFNLLCIVKHA